MENDNSMVLMKQKTLTIDMNNGLDEVVPFGKYRGRPVSAMMADKNYMEWLCNQSWFSQKCPKIYNVIVNNVQQDVDTPEHNRMQADFLREEVRSALISLWVICDERHCVGIDHDIEQIVKKFPSKYSHWIASQEVIKTKTEVEFEKRGWDVIIWCGRFSKLFVELKPEIGDDYPAILRQIKNRREVSNKYQGSVLVYKSYTGSTVDENEFRRIMILSGVSMVVKMDELPTDEIKAYIEKIKSDKNLDGEFLKIWERVRKLDVSLLMDVVGDENG